MDSGASCCLIDRRFLPEHIHINKSHTLEVVGVNGITSTLGFIDTLLEYNSREYPVRFHVMEQLPSHVVGLIGTNFLTEFGATIDFARMKMEFKNPRNEYFTIPARTEMIKYIQTNFTDTCVVLNQEIQPHVFIANAIVQPLNGRIPVRMVNVKNKPVKISELKPIIKPANDYLVLSTGHSASKTDRIQQLLKELDLNHLPKTEKQHVEQICSKYADIFCLENDQLTVTDIYSPVIKVKKDAQPIYSKAYKLPHTQKIEVEEQIQKMVKDKIIEKATSAWNSPILLVPKKSSDDKKKWRLVIDYRKLNTVVEDDKFPLPNIEDIIDALAGAKYFSHLDLSQGYYQCLLRPEDRPVTAFSTPSGQYQMTRLPMGLKISPSSFSRLMTIAMSGLDTTKCLVYLDDIIVFGKSIEEHNRNLIAVFEKLRRVNLKLNPKKCNFFKTELIYLGHLISAEGIKPDPAKVEAVKKWPTPSNAEEVKRFVAFANYYRKHIKNFANLCAPLNRLTRKNEKFIWNYECEQTFNELKKCFVDPPILDYPNFDKTNTFHLHTDASGYAIGAVLSNDNGKPIAYASKTLNQAETNYPTIEKELLALVWAIRHFRPYLYGRKFIVHTDHRPLVYLFSLTDPSSRLTKFRLALEEYDFDTYYIPGKDNVVADALSRISISDLKTMTMTVTTRSKSKINAQNHPSDAEGIDHPKTSDWEYIEIKVCPEIEKIEFSPKEIKVPRISTLVHLRGIMEKVTVYLKSKKDVHIIIRRSKSALYIIENLKNLNLKGIPKITIIGDDVKEIKDSKDRTTIINDYHILPTAGHAGINRTLHTIQQKFYWPNMKQDIRKFIKSCELCQKNRIMHKAKTPMIVTTTAIAAFDIIYLDLVGPLLPSSEGNQYILTTQCDLTKFVTATAIKDKSTETVAKAFVETIILNYGIPAKIVTDKGKEFMSKLFSEICELLKITKLNSTAYHHETIGGLENSHKSLGNFLRIYCGNSPLNWDNWLKYYQFAYNTTVHTTTNKTPFELVFGRMCTLPTNICDIKIIDPIYDFDNYSKLLKFKLQTSQKEVREKLIKEKLKRNENHNKNASNKIYNQGDLVLLKNENGSKMDNIYIGPYRVVNDEGPNVKIEIGNKHEIVHKGRIKYFNT